MYPPFTLKNKFNLSAVMIYAVSSSHHLLELVKIRIMYSLPVWKVEVVGQTNAHENAINNKLA